MADIFELLKDAGVEIPADKKDAFNREFRKTYKSEGEVSKVTGNLESDRDAWKKRAEDAEATLKTFDGIDPARLRRGSRKRKRLKRTMPQSWRNAILKTR